MRSAFSRRELLAGGLGVAGTMALSKWALSPDQVKETVRAAAGMRPAGADLSSVQHVVFLMQENRSFDHYFGSLGGVRGFDDHPAGSLGPFAQKWGHRHAPVLLPFHLDTETRKAECTYDLSHTWGAQHKCWDNGLMDMFVETHTSSAYEGNNFGPLTMGYYDEQDLPFSYALAKQFTICDNYFCSVLGPTHPNRLFQMSGTNDPDGVAGGPVLVTNSDAKFKFSASWTSMPELLSSNNVSWKCYNPFGSLYQPSSSFSLEISDNILLYFQQYSNPSSTLYQNAFGYYGPNAKSVYTSTGPDDFAHDVMTNQLPTVSWIIPPVGYDEHPPAPPALGEWYMQQVLNTLISNPTVWASTVLFIMYDENDGWFDHVSPPTAPAGTPGEYVTVNPLPATAEGIAGPIGLGVRVPMLVVSPFSTGGYVCSDVFDHTSQLRFLETMLGVTVPNLSSWRRSVTGDLTSALPHLGVADTTPPTLPVVSNNTKQRPLSECSAQQLTEDNVVTRYRVSHPRKLVMPTQAPGTLTPTPT